MSDIVLIDCPRCGRLYPTYLAALSRRDNVTKVCHYCGPTEALEDAGLMGPYEGEPYWQTQQAEGDTNEEVRISIDSEVNT